jgi:hypothetical protein
MSVIKPIVLSSDEQDEEESLEKPVEPFDEKNEFMNYDPTPKEAAYILESINREQPLGPVQNYEDVSPVAMFDIFPQQQRQEPI